MADIVSKKTRRKMMSGIHGKNTKPELFIRSQLHQRGFRYRLHNSSLPGKPDLVFKSRKAVIFVNGCFWHGHDCPLFKWPSTRPDWWRDKIEGNRTRDIRTSACLARLGWRQAHVWECALKGKQRWKPDDIMEQLVNWLDSHKESLEIRGKSND